MSNRGLLGERDQDGNFVTVRDEAAELIESTADATMEELIALEEKLEEAIAEGREELAPRLELLRQIMDVKAEEKPQDLDVKF